MSSVHLTTLFGRPVVGLVIQIVVDGPLRLEHRLETGIGPFRKATA